MIEDNFRSNVMSSVIIEGLVNAIYLSNKMQRIEYEHFQTTCMLKVDIPWMLIKCSQCKIFGHTDKACSRKVVKEVAIV